MSLKTLNEDVMGLNAESLEIESTDKAGLYVGLKAAIIASSCCTLPLVFALLFSLFGVGSVTAALAIPKYKWVFISFGTLFLAISLYLQIKKQTGGSCSLKDFWKCKLLIALSILSYIIVFTLVLYVILPFVAERAYSLI